MPVPGGVPALGGACSWGVPGVGGLGWGLVQGVLGGLVQGSPGGPGLGGCLVPGGCLVETPWDGYCCRRYASYWNAFLFDMLSFHFNILCSLCSVVFLAFTLELPIQTSLSVARKLQVFARSGKKCEHFSKTSTPLERVSVSNNETPLSHTIEFKMLRDLIQHFIKLQILTLMLTLYFHASVLFVS